MLFFGVLFTAHAQQETFLELVTSGTVEEVRAAIRDGAYIDARTEDGAPALMYTAEHNENPEVIWALLDAGAKVKVRDIVGRTAFDYAHENDVIKKKLMFTGGCVKFAIK